MVRVWHYVFIIAHCSYAGVEAFFGHAPTSYGAMAVALAVAFDAAFNVHTGE